jgi:ribosomal protein S27E
VTTPTSTRPPLTALERGARDAWHRWGDGYALYTRCDGCGNIAHCRGRTRDAVLCLTCFDLGIKPTRTADTADERTS